MKAQPTWNNARIKLHMRDHDDDNNNNNNTLRAATVCDINIVISILHASD